MISLKKNKPQVFKNSVFKNSVFKNSVFKYKHLNNSRGLQTSLIIGMLFSSCIAFSAANAHNDALRMTLHASKVVYDTNGHVSYIPVKTAKIGTVIQYRATYFNSIDKPINDLMVTLPIPQGMSFTGQAYPPSAQASIDDTNYADIPLMRRVKGLLIQVPFAEYTSLRWNIKLLPAHKTADVALNTIVN